MIVRASKPNVDDDRYFGIYKASKILGIARNTLYVATQKGKVEYTFIDGRMAFSGASLKEAWRLYSIEI